jgi:recombination protein RecA
MAKKKEKEVVEDLTGVSRTQQILKKINATKSKDYGDFLDLQGSDLKKLARISTGIVSLDIITGGGWPCGRICEIYGANSSGKSTSCLHSIASCQAGGGVTAFIDSENALDLNYAEHLGVDVNNILFLQNDSGEEAFSAILDLTEYLKTGDLIVVDSVAALTPRVMVQSSMEDKFMGTQAKLISEGLAKVKAKVNKCGVILLFTNQTRQKIGGMGYGPQIETPGGNALKFYSSIRVQTTSIGKIKDGENVVGNKTKFTTVKNKTYPPFKDIETELIFGEGIIYSRDLLIRAVDADIVNRSGAWYKYGEASLGAGMEKALNFLSENPEAFNEIAEKVKGFYGLDYSGEQGEFQPEEGDSDV